MTSCPSMFRIAPSRARRKHATATTVGVGDFGMTSRRHAGSLGGCLFDALGLAYLFKVSPNRCSTGAPSRQCQTP